MNSHFPSKHAYTGLRWLLSIKHNLHFHIYLHDTYKSTSAVVDLVYCCQDSTLNCPQVNICGVFFFFCTSTFYILCRQLLWFCTFVHLEGVINKPSTQELCMVHLAQKDRYTHIFLLFSGDLFFSYVHVFRLWSVS